MGVGQFNLTAADPLMKIHFNPRITKQFNTAAVLYNRFYDGKGIPISNRGLEIPLHTSPNVAFTWYADGGPLPAGGSQGLNRATVGFFSFALSVGFTGAALDAAGDDAVTYARALAFNVKNATIDAIKYLNIYAFGDGTGTLGQVGTTVTVNSTVPGAITLDVSGAVDNARYLRIGMALDVIHAGAVAGTLQIDSISTQIAFATTTTVTCHQFSGSTFTATATDTLVISGSYQLVMSGLKFIVDNGTIATVFQNVNRSTVIQYQGNVIAVGGVGLLRDHLRRSIATIQTARGTVNLNDLEIWAHPAMLHSYADMGWTLKRFQGSGAKQLDLGYTAYEWEGVPWIIDTDASKDHLFFLDRSSMFKVTARELSFDDRTGSVLRQVPGSTAGTYNDAFVAFLLFRGNIGCYSPNSNVKVNGFAVPAGY